MHVFFIIFIAFLTIFILPAERKVIPKIPIFFTIILIIWSIIVLYLAPYGFDRLQYLIMFNLLEYQTFTKDPGWVNYMWIIKSVVGDNSDAFFLINDIIFTGGFFYFAYKNFPKEYWWYYLVIVFISTGYYNGATNILRSGLGMSLVFYGLANFAPECKHRIKALLFCLIGCTIHLSTGLILSAFVLAYFFPKHKVYLAIWSIFVVLSYFDTLNFIGPYISDFMGDESYRFDVYVDSIGQDIETYKNAGFRFDFLFYSAIPIIFALTYINKYKYRNPFYYILFSAYLIINSFWLIVIRMPFGDRFALMSWIFIPCLTTYPLLSSKSTPIVNKKRWLLYSLLLPTALNIWYLIR